MTAPKRRWLVNAVTLVVAGPLVSLLFFAGAWIVERPDPLDVWPVLCAFLFVGLVAGVIACSVYLVTLVWARLTNQDG